MGGGFAQTQTNRMLNDTVKECRVSPEDKNLELIDAAIEASKQALHACCSGAAKAHLEYVLAFLNESWISESGQESSEATKVFNDVAYVQSLGDLFSNLHAS